MAKLNLTRAFDAGQVIQTLNKAGVGGLDDFLTYMQEFCNQVIGAFRKTLTVEDNLDSFVKTISLNHGVTQKIVLPDPKKVPRHVWITKCIPFQNGSNGFGWQIASDSTLEVISTFAGAPTTNVETTIMMLF